MSIDKSELKFVCSPLARWLPRVLGAVAILAGWLVAARFSSSGFAFGGGLSLQHMVLAVGGVVGWWIVRQGAELRQTYIVHDRGLVWIYENRRRELLWNMIERLHYDAPFARERRWLPALIIEDTEGRRHRVVSLVTDGDRLLREIQRRSERDDLKAWIEARGLSARMAASRRRVVYGYGLAGVVLLIAAVVGRA